MKRYIFLPIMVLSLVTQAQDSYTNEFTTNNSSDVIGTARFVGMGGAMGALGADMSVISWNPAGIGLFRKNDISTSFGGSWGKSSIPDEDRGKASFDQIGFVISSKGHDPSYINFSFNYQKKINFNHNYSIGGALDGLSQLDLVACLGEYDEGWQYNLPGLALENNYIRTINANGTTSYENGYVALGRGSSYSHAYTFHSEGSLQAYDMNISCNIEDRTFLGMTVGFDNMRYRGWSCYGENDVEGEAKYDLSNDYSIKGWGVNVKVGAIFRPIEDNPFRVGFAVETPTWYNLRSSTYFDFYDYQSDKYTEQLESYLKYTFRSPWKVRASMGSTIGSVFAWDVDYEMAAFGHTRLGYPRDDYDDRIHSSVPDEAMNRLTRRNFRATHTVRAGIELRPTSAFALRLGYNYISSAYKNHQYNLNSAVMDYATGTSYTRLSDTNILTAGLGYRGKNVYFDLAYKVRRQTGDFYAFDGSFANTSVQPAGFDLTRQTITCTLGVKF